MKGKLGFVERFIHAACIGLIVVGVLLGGAVRNVSAQADTTFVRADAIWVPTGIYLEQNRYAVIEVHGMAITGNHGLLPESKSGPAGQTWNEGCGFYEAAPPPCALDGAPYGALLGRIGEEGEVFLIGGETEFTAMATGDLYLAVNDNLAFYDDNSGGFSVIMRSGNLMGGYITARPDIDAIEGHAWTPGIEVKLQIFDPDLGVLYRDAQIATDDPGANVYFDLAAAGFDLQPGQRIRMSSGTYHRELWIAPVAVSGFDFQTATVSGTCDPSIFCWVHMDSRDFNGFSMEGGNWTAYFDYLYPWEWGWAFQWDADGDETRVRFQINTDDARMISAFPNEDVVEGGYWKAGRDVTMSVEEGGAVVYEETLTPEIAEDQPGGSYVRFDLTAHLDITPGTVIMMTNGWIHRTLTISPIAVTGVNVDEGTVSGICDPSIFCWTHMNDGRDFTDFSMDEAGNWTAQFEYLTPGEWGQAFQWDSDGDETRIQYEVTP